jgi:hypothetical protein
MDMVNGLKKEKNKIKLKTNMCGSGRKMGLRPSRLKAGPKGVMLVNIRS